MIGEAARRVSPEGKLRVAAIPWPRIIGMQYKLVHNYTEFDYDEVWRTATEDLPPLIDAPREVLAE